MTGNAIIRNSLVAVLIAGILLFFAGLAGAAEAGHADSVLLLKDFIYRCVNFAVLVGLLAYFLRKPLGEVLSARREALVKNLSEAHHAREVAEGRAALLMQQLEDGGREIEALRRRLENETEKEREQLLEEARKMADTIRREAASSATRQIERARQELRAEAAALAIQLAEKQMARGLTDDDQDRLVNQYLEQLGERR